MNHLTKHAIPFLALSLLASCGGSKSGGSSKSKQPITINQEAVAEDGSNIDGSYVADLAPINYYPDDSIKIGSVLIERENDSFRTTVKLDRGAPGVWHKQGIYLGNSCPIPYTAYDKNGDAFVDIAEAKAASFDMIIPLDGNISAQDAGRNQYPVGDAAGTYMYSQEASFAAMFGDLKAVDSNTSDNIVKLPADGGLSLIGRVVIVQGAPDDFFLPITIATQGSHTAHQSLPIACGVIRKLDATEEGNRPQGPTTTPTPAPPRVEPPSNPLPGPTPIPTPTPTPTPTPDPDPEDENPETEEPRRWYDRVEDWIGGRRGENP